MTTTNDTLARARAAIARLREAERCLAFSVDTTGARTYDRVTIDGDELDALLRLAEAVERLWSEWSGHGVDIGKVGDFTGDVDGFNAAVIDAALAELAELAGDEGEGADHA